MHMSEAETLEAHVIKQQTWVIYNSKKQPIKKVKGEIRLVTSAIMVIWNYCQQSIKTKLFFVQNTPRISGNLVFLLSGIQTRGDVLK